jgi:hypothetical protein
MKRTLLGVFAAVAIMGAPALAADDSMAKKPNPEMMEATMMCRPAMTGEKPTAMMGTKGVVCKTMAKMDSKKMGPKTAGMTVEQADAAWRAWLEQVMMIQNSGGGG